MFRVLAGVALCGKEHLRDFTLSWLHAFVNHMNPQKKLQLLFRGSGGETPSYPCALWTTWISRTRSPHGLLTQSSILADKKSRSSKRTKREKVDFLPPSSWTWNLKPWWEHQVRFICFFAAENFRVFTSRSTSGFMRGKRRIFGAPIDSINKWEDSRRGRDSYRFLIVLIAIPISSRIVIKKSAGFHSSTWCYCYFIAQFWVCCWLLMKEIGASEMHKNSVNTA